MLIRKVADKSGKEPPRDEETGRLLEPWPLSHVEVVSAGDREFVSRQLVESWLADGVASIGAGKLTIHAKPDEVSFRIVQAPGVYCSHCDAKLDAGDQVAQAHVKREHGDAASPDPESPAGYAVVNGYRLEAIG